MAKVIYRKYQAVNLNPGYIETSRSVKRSEIPSTHDYRKNVYTFNQNTGTFKVGESNNFGGAFGSNYAYMQLSNDRVLRLDQFADPSKWIVIYSAPNPPRYVRGNYVGEVTAEEDTYPRDGEKGGYWYVWDRYANTAPKISGGNLDLGSKFEDFQIEYIIQDGEGDDVSVEIKVDGVTKQSPSKTTLGVRRFFTVPIKDYKIGNHTIEIVATDNSGASTVRAYTFNKVNSAPVISGADGSLGAKNTAFTYTYTVTDRESDNIDVIEKVNGEVIRVLSNATLGSEYRITITDEQIRQIELNASNTIEIEATDGTATTFRRVTFIRNNMPPIIADRDKDLGDVTNSLEYSWSATDTEKDKMTAVVYLDDRILSDRHSISDGANQTIKIDGQAMQKLARGKHTIRIVVEDDKGFSSTRTLTFTRVVNRLVMKLAGKGIETDELASRVLISTAGIHVAKGVDVKYEVCNNSFDDSPTWEDATTMTLANRAFNFVNDTKTADKAGVDIKVTITRGDAKGQSYISAIGGSFD